MLLLDVEVERTRHRVVTRSDGLEGRLDAVDSGTLECISVLVKEGEVLISDFGSSKVLGQLNTPYVVSRYYRAPELILGIAEYTLSIDMFSLGVIFYEFLMKRLPFKGKSEGQQLIEIFKALGPPDKTLRTLLKDHIKDYDRNFECLWSIKANEATVWAGFALLPITNKERGAAIEFLKACWSYDFLRRISALEAAKLSFFDDVRWITKLLTRHVGFPLK